VERADLVGRREHKGRACPDCGARGRMIRAVYNGREGTVIEGRCQCQVCKAVWDEYADMRTGEIRNAKVGEHERTCV
jgi:hypothetical protein